MSRLDPIQQLAELETLTAADDAQAVEFCREIYREMDWPKKTGTGTIKVNVQIDHVYAVLVIPPA